MISPYVYSVFANMFWGLGAQFYAYYGRKFSSVWINAFKALAAGIFFTCAVIIAGGFHEIIPSAAFVLLLSGLIGLGVADIFLVKAYAGMGPGRTMMLFSFQPLFVGVISYFAFGQVINPQKFISIIFFIICIVIFSLETFRKEGHWNIKNTLFAFLGMVFDGIGVMLTRYGFDKAPDITVFEGNLYRVIGALVFFVIVSRVFKFSFRANFQSLSPSRRFILFFAVFLGTFVSLGFYLQAIRTGDLAIVTAITVTGVIFASLFESIFKRAWPTKYLYIAFVFFTAGMYFLLS